MMSAKIIAQPQVSNTKTDIAIVGAGLVGMAAAIALYKAGFVVTLIDSQAPNTTSDGWDARIYAISPKNISWLQALGVWQYVNTARITPIQAMALKDDSEATAILLSAEDANQDALGFIIESANLSGALLRRVRELNIDTLFNAPCNAAIVDESSAMLKMHTNNIEHVVNSDLLVAADGAASWVRKQLGIALDKKPYEQTAIVANFEVNISPANIARQWFTHDAMQSNNILAWLPLPTDNNKHYISIVWSVSNEYAAQLMALPEGDFTHQVSLAGNAILGEMKLVTHRATFPLVLQKAETFYQKSAVLLGDAAHVIHPMAGQGMNLGFRDVIDLVRVLESKSAYQHISDKNLLGVYMRSRKSDLLNMQILTDGLFELFAQQNSVIKKVRQWGFAATKLQLIKKLLVAYAIKQ